MDSSRIFYRKEYSGLLFKHSLYQLIETEAQDSLKIFCATNGLNIEDYHVSVEYRLTRREYDDEG